MIMLFWKIRVVSLRILVEESVKIDKWRYSPIFYLCNQIHRKITKCMVVLVVISKIPQISPQFINEELELRKVTNAKKSKNIFSLFTLPFHLTQQIPFH